jgi:hypothetical protein
LETSPFGGGYYEGLSIGRMNKKSEQYGVSPITDLESMKSRIRECYSHSDWRGSRILVSWVSGLSDFYPVSEEELERIIKKSVAEEQLSVEEQGKLYGAATVMILEHLRDKIDVCQLCYGTQVLPGNRGAGHFVQRAAPWLAGSMGRLFNEFPDIHFNIMNGFESDDAVWCSNCIAYGNVSLAGYWWQMFYPHGMKACWHRRFDMVPVTRLMGYFSDGYCVDWVYGRSLMTRKVLSEVMAERIEFGLWDYDDALAAAKAVLYDTPMEIMVR